MSEKQITPEKIVNLQNHEVFVMGTNESGFHGAGSAGFAFRNDVSINWRKDKQFLSAMNSLPGSLERIGKWSIFGQSSGLMQGHEGKSYGIITITKPGQKRSRPLYLIQHDIYNFLRFAKVNNHLIFYVTEIGTNYAGYKVQEIAPLFEYALVLNNVYLPKRFYNYLKSKR